MKNNNERQARSESVAFTHKINTKKALATVAGLMLVAAVTFQPAVAQQDQAKPADPLVEFAGQRVVKILQEPRHRTVNKDGDIYLLDVQINPGDMTLPHTHDSAIMYTFISNGEGPLFGRVSSNTDYVKENFTHQVSNEGPGLFRIIAMANYGKGQSELTAERPEGVADEPQLENEWFRSYRLKLEPGDETSVQTHKNPTAVVQVTEGLVQVSRADGITAELDGMGDWAWRDADAPFKVKNAGDSAVEVVINEARR